MKQHLSIEQLTPAQEAQLPVYRDKWIAIGLATGPVDMPKAKKAVADAYIAASLPPPQYYIHACSPVSGALIAMILRGRRLVSVRDAVRDSVWDSVRDSVWDSVVPSVWDSVVASVWDSVRASVWGSVRDSVRASVGEQIYGSMDAPWLSFYDFFLRECKLQCCARLLPLMNLAQYCGWWAPYKNAAILQDRPSRIVLDARGRLHHETQMAVTYPDTWGVYAWHGVRVPEKVILAPASLTIEEVHAEQNAEIQRVMLERFGWSRYLEAVNAQLVDADVDTSGRGTMRGLYRLSLHNRPAQVLICTCDSTGKTFHLEVPHEITTCSQAAMWLANEREPLALLVQS